MRLLIIFCLLLEVAFAAKSTYLITVPRILFKNGASTATITISSLPSDATITITLKKGNVNYAKYSKVITSSASNQIVRIPFSLVRDPGNGQIIFEIKSEGGLKFSHSTNLELKMAKDRMFIQTDKPIYKPGGKIRFRVVGIDKDLKPLSLRKPIDEVYILNPSGSRMVQWTKTTLDVGMASFEMKLSTKPVLGDWKIVARAGSLQGEAVVKVEKYVLPKFEVEIKPAPYVLKIDEKTTIKICGKYTYGKKVNGVLTANICTSSGSSWWRNHKNNMKCVTFNQKVDQCTDVVFPLRKLMTSRRGHAYNGYWMNRIDVNATITEDGTGIKQSAQHQITLHRQKLNMKFQTPASYKPGFLFKVKLLLTTPDGRPAREKTRVNLKIRKSSSVYNVPSSDVTVHNGVHEFSVIPDDDAENYSFTAKEIYSSRGSTSSSKARASATVKSWYSPSKRYVKITNTENLNVGDKAKISVDFSSNSVGEKTLNYILVCKGVAMEASSTNVRQLSTYVTFTVTEAMSPKCRLLVYYFHGDEFISDSQVIDFELSSKNKVSLTFDDDEKKPGERIGLTMKASPGSKFAVSAVDRSIMLLGETNDIEEDDVVSILSEQDVPPTSYRPHSSRCSRRRWYRSIMPYWPRVNRFDGREALRNTGVKYFTNADVDVIPCPKLPPYPIYPMWGGGAPGGRGRGRVNEGVRGMKGAGGRPGPQGDREVMMVMKESLPMSRKTKLEKPSTKVIKRKTKEPELRIRKEFPETWLWFDEYISSTGEKKMTFNIPDTLTTWSASGFAMSSIDGIGVARPTTVKAFQPFFISLNLPYSVKRGEILKIPATVFNYLDKCLVIGISMDSSDEFSPLTTLSQKVCVCGGQGKTVKFGIKPTKLGRIELTVHARSYGASTDTCGPNTKPVTSVIAADAMTKKLLVEAEGIKKEYSKSVFFCPQDSQFGVFKDKLELHLPKQLVPGSVHAELNVVGDLLGPSMSGLDKLLAMPYGCGEQNMLKFAPNVYIMDYLKASGQSDAKIESKAIEYMTSGYQRELTYKHSNGGYSAFGERDDEASTWLTAFVLRTYAQARRYIYIDPKEIELSKNWLLSLQDTRKGCFKELGMVHHKEMKGGVTGGITMTAFVVIALLEADLPHNDYRIQKAIGCMENNLNDVTDSYTTSVLAFALKMAGSDKADVMLNKLNGQAIKKEGLVHWAKKSSKTHSNEYKYYHSAPSVDIEMTAYALMAYMGGEKPYGSRLDHLQIVKWLVKQRNSDGGFTSTQDTCVGLQALSQYSAVTFSGEFDLNIITTESLPPNRQNHIKVTNANKLVLQKFKLETPLPFEIDIEASGKGCALLQANVKYNEQKPSAEDSFYLKYSLKQDDQSLTCRHEMQVCGSFTGKGKSNMALIDVAMVSGFEPVLDELDMQLQMNKNVPFTQYEFIDGVLTFYFNEFERTSKCVDFAIEQESEVQDRKPAAVKIYDYYDKDNEATKMYSVGKCPETNIVS